MRNALSLKRLLNPVILFILCIAAANPSIAARAETTGGFSIKAVIPENQIDTRQTYFDLRMNPSDEQTIEITVTNSRDTELVAEVQLNAASTSRNGLIVYTEPNVRDELLKTSINDVATLQAESLTVAANSSETVKIDIKMPDEPYDGVILGGITVTGGEVENDEPSDGVSLKNKITYVIALVLTENDNEVAPDFDLKAITPTLINHKTAVVATLQNKAARIVKGMDVHAQVYKKGSDAVLHEFISDSAEMAPLSAGNFVISWENARLTRGTYRLKMTADYDGKLWEWDEEFTIGDEADDLNKDAVGLKHNFLWLYLLIGCILLIIILIFVFRRKRREPEETDRR